MPRGASTAPPIHAEDELRQAIIALVEGASFELSARDPLAGEGLREVAPAGRAVYIAFAPTDTHHGILAAATRLKRAGFAPVPHIAARTLASFTQFNDYLARMAGEAGIDRALVIAGDIERPVGPFATSLELLNTGLFERYGIRRIDIAGYPEGHPRVSRANLAEALTTKCRTIPERGLEPRVLTQFGFEAAPIIAWLKALRLAGVDVPVRIGLAGPASIATLAKFAVRCGIGNSLRALTGGHTSFARLLVEADPGVLVTALAGSAQDRSLGIAGLHIFTFGGVRRTTAWLAKVRRGAFDCAESGNFLVNR
jgi:methylenetetrahydrofolate reductase (NADPH)